MTIRLLKFTEYSENALCIYRNLWRYSKIAKIIIAISITMELLLITSHFVIIILGWYINNLVDIVYFCHTNIHSMFLIILACYHCKKYKFFIAHLNIAVKYFGVDTMYLKNLEKKNSVFFTYMFVLCSVELLIIIGFSYFQSLPDIPLFWYLLYHASLIVGNFRYFIEFFVLYCLLHVISEQLLSLTRSINEQISFKTESQKLIAEVDNWSNKYTHIKKTVELFNDIFAIQVCIQ